MFKFPFNKPYVTNNEIKYLKEAYERRQLAGDGYFTKKCHDWLEQKTGCHKALLTHSCTAALEMAALLIDIKGIGPWSIKMFMIFCLNRPDIFSPDDIGLLKAMGLNYFNDIRPTKNEAESFSLKWKPWRTIASWYLWRSIDPEVVLY